MDEISFKPDYGASNIVATILISLLGIALITFGYQENSNALLGGGAFCFLIVVFSLIAYPRKIIFSKNHISVKRLFLPDQLFEYQYFSDMGGTAIRFGRRGLSLLNMKNSGDLISIFQRLIDERKIQPSQIQGKLVIEEALTAKALKYSLIPGLILSIVANLALETYFHVEVNGRLVSGAVFLALFISIYVFLKNKQEME